MHVSTDRSPDLGGGGPIVQDQKRNRLQYIKPQPQPLLDTSYFSRNGSSEDLSALFDFDSPSTSKLAKKPTLSTEASFGFGDGWDPLNVPPLSPPDSALIPNEPWRPFDHSQQFPHNILTQIDPSRVRTQYGQTTPPDDEDIDGLETELLRQDRHDNPFFLENPSLALRDSEKKHKHYADTSGSGARSNKRVRKHARGGKASALDPNNPEDARRSKFLERNRVAASKCRQKKKEWTSNLESRARNLQKDNHQLRQLVDSCKEEVLFLKAEMLKHSACGSMEIQDYLKQGVQSFGGLPRHNIKAETSPMCTAPPSRVSSPLDQCQSSLTGVSQDGSRSFSEESGRRSSVSDETLERLLTSQFIHDTSEDGIAERLAR